MKLKGLLILCVSILFLTLSCSDEDYITPGELVAIELNDAISGYHINYVKCYIGDNSISRSYEENKSFYIEGAFFHIGGDVYNLDKMVMYNIQTSGGSVTLSLYWEQ